MAIAITALPAAKTGDSAEHALVLATGNTDSCIHLYTRGSEPQSQFTKSIKLTGHEDWVNSLAFLNFNPISAEAISKNSTISHWQPDDVILASGSEDKYIRIWRISLAGSQSIGEEAGSSANQEPSITSDKAAAQAMLDAFSDSLATGASITDITSSVIGSSSLGGFSGSSSQLSTRAHVISATIGSSRYAYAVSLDSVLVGHDGWVHSVAWNQSHASGPVLVSASSDSSVIVWAPDADAGVWSSVARLGEVGGAILGFLGAAMDPAGDSIFAHGYHGSYHMWSYRSEPPTSGDLEAGASAVPAYSTGLWEPQVSLSGHFGSVQDVAWDPHGGYLLSLSLDQTARLYAPWTSSSSFEDDAGQSEYKGWHEIARPQIHGYDMRCAAFVAPFQYVSGADEKVVRVFQATQQFVSSWRSLTSCELPVTDSESKLAVGASLPVLGLSNKAVDEEQVRVAREASDGAGQDLDDNYKIRQTHTEVLATASVLAKDASGGSGASSPPLEEYLLRHTLWPEVDKLYGHPYEVFSVAASHLGDWIATSCKAASERHANIRLYSTHTWQPPVVMHDGENTASNPPGDKPATRSASPLAAHALTITRLRFSPAADKFLLSVSRDRSWSLFARIPESSDQPSSAAGAEVYSEPTGPYRLLHRQAKAHARIIWDAAWSPDARFFATASRDKSIKLWPAPSTDDAQDGYKAKPTALTFPEAVTAVDFVPALIKKSTGDKEHLQYALAAGLENGRVFVLVSGECGTDEAIPKAWQPYEIPRTEAHTDMIHRLAWRPRPNLGTATAESVWQLASGSDDQSVRIVSVDIAKL
ncbi:Elongator subunit elp2 [Dipsacomyces acuminosporus]|nr:Elongator subunit elp2 [Dipsacomyces acuminosporus]